MRARSLLVVVVTGVLAAAGCTAETPEPAEPTASVTPSASPTPSPTPTETQTIDMSDPELGVVFVDTPALTGAEAAVHNTAALLAIEDWRALTTGTISPLVRTFVAQEMVSEIENRRQVNEEGGWSFDGTIRYRIFDVSVDGDAASASVCIDYADVTYAKDGGSPQTRDEADRFAVRTLQLSASADAALWQVNDDDEQIVPC